MTEKYFPKNTEKIITIKRFDVLGTFLICDISFDGKEYTFFLRYTKIKDHCYYVTFNFNDYLKFITFLNNLGIKKTKYKVINESNVMKMSDVLKNYHKRNKIEVYDEFLNKFSLSAVTYTEIDVFFCLIFLYKMRNKHV